MRILEEKIFCIGLNKTGTTSMGDALAMLGYKRLGWTPGIATLQIQRWHEGRFANKTIDTIKNHDAFEDLPWPLCFERLDELCPNAKFILTTRKDTDTWLDSIQRHIAGKQKWLGHYLVYGSYDPVRDQELYRMKYEAHNNAVREYFKSRPEKCIDMCFELNDGWEKLCSFLECKIPSGTFPHSNKYANQIKNEKTNINTDIEMPALHKTTDKIGKIDTGVHEKRNLFIHIGVHCTATATIQNLMTNNWKVLKNKGVLYPLFKTRHDKILNPIYWKKSSAEQLSKKLLTLAERHSSIHTILLSDENISMWKDFSCLKPLCEYFNVKFILSMRRQDLWLEEWWSLNVAYQFFKNWSHIPFQDFLAGREQFHWIDYDHYLQRLEALFGIENIHPYVFEQSQMPNGPVAMFCNQLGLENISEMVPLKNPNKNTSFLPEIAEFFRHLPLDEAKLPMRNDLFINAMRTIDNRLRAENHVKLMIPYDERQKVIHGYEAGNTAVARRYFSRDQLFFESLPSANAEIMTPALHTSAGNLMERLVIPYFHELIVQLNER